MEDQVELDRYHSDTHDALPNEKLVSGEGQQNCWSAYFPEFGSDRSISSHGVRDRSTSHTPNQPRNGDSEEPIPGKHLRGENNSPSDSSFGSIHPLPRSNIYGATNRFNTIDESRVLSEPVSSFDVGSNSHEEYMFDSRQSLFQESDWTSSKLGYSPLFQSRSSPDVISATTVTDTHAAADNANDGTVFSAWDTFQPQSSWSTHCQDPDQPENIWVEARCFPSMSQQYRRSESESNQFISANDDSNGLPWGDNCDPSYTQHPSLPGSVQSADPGVVFQSQQSGVGLERDYFQLSTDMFVLPRNLRIERSPRSNMEGYGNHHEQPRDENTPTSCPNDTRNAFLIECKRRGLSYKDIKRIGGFKEAESTLRGRFRTLTKSKDQRVRKPQWQEKDIKLLGEAVHAYSDRQTSCNSACRPRGTSQPPKVSWKKVAQYIWVHGGSYYFGNATCKKKWCEVQNKRG